MKLFEPITIRGMELKNRIVMPPMVVGIGAINQRAIAYYVERAQGGAGCIIVAPVSVSALASDDAWGQAGKVASFIERLRSLTQAVHTAGAKIGLQLVNMNRYPPGVRMDNGGEPVAPSARAGKPTQFDTETYMRELTIPEIESIIEMDGKAAAGVCSVLN